MKKINIKKFGFDYFMSGAKKVQSLNEGALKYGGATQFDNGIYSNIEGDNFIKVNKDKNNLSVFIPSTMDIDNNIDNTDYITSIINKMKLDGYDLKNIKFYDTVGSWYSSDLKKVVIENITIVTLTKKDITENDILNFKKYGLYIKNVMKQESVSLQFNNSLALV